MDKYEELDLDYLIRHTPTPYKPQLPTSQQVATLLAVLTLVGPAALGGMPVIPVTVFDEHRRQQDEIQQVSESSVGVHQSSQEAEVALALSQRRLAQVTREVEDIHTHDVSEADVIHAANRVLAGQVTPQLEGRFRQAFTRVAWDSVDLFILRDNEEHVELGQAAHTS